jgi:hypothetical protein
VPQPAYSKLICSFIFAAAACHHRRERSSPLFKEDLNFIQPKQSRCSFSPDGSMVGRQSDIPGQMMTSTTKVLMA